MQKSRCGDQQEVTFALYEAIQRLFPGTCIISGDQDIWQN